MAGDNGKFGDLLTADNAAVAAYWLFWFAIIALATQQLGYLLSWGPDWSASLAVAGCFCGFKAFAQHQSADREAKDLRNQTRLVRALASRAGMDIIGVSHPSQTDADPAMMAIIEATVGLEEYNNSKRAPYSLDGSLDGYLDRALPPEMHGKLKAWMELHAVDRTLLRAAQTIGNLDRGLLHDVRLIVMRELYLGVSNGASCEAVIAELKGKVSTDSPIYRWLDTTLKAYLREDAAGMRIGTWDIIRSWLKTDQPRTFDDLCGEDGRGLPPIPQAILDALKPLPPGKTYTS